ncbi:MAG: hypothetical protein HYX39_11660 [Bacteroidetes bacterium]|nr:hypothetical protein [Bacteroidota bacterium]
MKTTYFILSFLVAGLLFNACKKDTKTCNDENNPNCPNYINPCDGKKDAKADFGIYEIIDWAAVEADTVWCIRPVVLRVKLKADNYKWLISGVNTVYTDSIVDLTGKMPYPNGGFVTVTLIVTNNVGNCTTVKKLDSLTKVFYAWPCANGYCNYSQWPQNYVPIMGTYIGSYKSNPTQTLSVSVFDTITQGVWQTYTNPCSPNTLNNRRYDIIRGIPYPNHSFDKIKVYDQGAVISYVGASGVILKTLKIIGRLDTTVGHCNGIPGTFPLMNGIAWLDLANSKKMYVNVNYLDTLDKKWRNDFFTGFKIN